MQNISRRHFHRALAGATMSVASGLAGRGRVVRADPTTSPPAKQPATRYIDLHVHLGQPWNERGPLTAEMLLSWMDAHDVAKAVVLPLISPESWFYPMTTGWVLEQTKPYRDRLIPFCAVDPRSVNLGGYKGFADILHRYVDAGAKGMGEHKWGGAIDDPRNIELLRACGDAKLPVLFHLDNVRNTDHPGLPGLEKVLSQAPETVLIGHAPGWWASISGNATQQEMGGYPRGPVTPGGAIDRLMEKYPNLYGDLSAGSGANALRRDMDFGQQFLIRRADRIVFGTDYLARQQAVPQFELLDQFNLAPAVRRKIERDNAARLLQLEEHET
ncbi:MAG: amidohydrolase family protein [Pirellulales bacterium]